MYKFKGGISSEKLMCYAFRYHFEGVGGRFPYLALLGSGVTMNFYQQPYIIILTSNSRVPTHVRIRRSIREQYGSQAAAC